MRGKCAPKFCLTVVVQVELGVPNFVPTRGLARVSHGNSELLNCAETKNVARPSEFLRHRAKLLILRKVRLRRQTLLHLDRRTSYPVLANRAAVRAQFLSRWHWVGAYPLRDLR
jgi:hypothetical protein